MLGGFVPTAEANFATSSGVVTPFPVTNATPKQVRRSSRRTRRGTVTAVLRGGHRVHGGWTAAAHVNHRLPEALITKSGDTLGLGVPVILPGVMWPRASSYGCVAVAGGA